MNKIATGVLSEFATSDSHRDQTSPEGGENIQTHNMTVAGSNLLPSLHKTAVQGGHNYLGQAARIPRHRLGNDPWSQ